MTTSKIGFLTLEILERDTQIKQLQSKMEEMKKEQESIRSQLANEVRCVRDKNLFSKLVFQIKHGGETGLFHIDINGRITEIEKVIQA